MKSAIQSFKKYDRIRRMDRDLFSRLRSQIEKYGAKVPDSKDGHDQKYEISDALKAAFGVFFFQFPSVLQLCVQCRKNKSGTTSAAF